MNPNIKQQLTTVTTFSKILAGILFIAMPFIGFYLGMQYSKSINTLSQLPAGVISASPTSQPVACTEEAKVCPDGSSVGRTGPNCEFAACPSTQPVNSLKVAFSCRENPKYLVVSREYEEGVQGNDFLIKNKTTELENCDYWPEKGDNEIKGVKGRLLGLTDNFLLLNRGWLEGIAVYGLTSRKEVYAEKNVDVLFSPTPVNVNGDVIDYWATVDRKMTSQNCPEGNGWLSRGLGVFFQAHIRLDLKTLERKSLEEKCHWSQG